ncbi:hypothetical protein KKE06_05965 [Candidatus Micrarchaeota archaeon]|nr:hypothetical protein [Candidatus Micrarchaeota archaeon]
MIFLQIGIPKETKENEYRVALVPKDVEKLVERGHEVFVEQNVGGAAGFPNHAYEAIGAQITPNAWQSPLVVKVKALASDPLQENQVFMAYLHVEKGQSPDLLKKLLEKKVTGYAFEEICDKTGNRMVNLGFEAGIVGMYEGLRTFGRHQQENPFQSLPPIKEIDQAKAFKFLSKLELKETVYIAIMGAGNVSRGCQEVLSKTGIKPQILIEEHTPHIEQYLPDLDILVNAVAWFPGQSHLVTKKMLEIMKKKRVNRGYFVRSKRCY